MDPPRNGREPSDLPKSMEKRSIGNLQSRYTNFRPLMSDSRHLASEAKLQRCGKALAQVTRINFDVQMVLKMVLKSPQILPELLIP